jgi:hypothetical protein
MDLLGYYCVICRIDMFTEPIHVQGPAKMHRQKAGILKQPCKLFLLLFGSFMAVAVWLLLTF